MHAALLLSGAQKLRQLMLEVSRVSSRAQASPRGIKLEEPPFTGPVESRDMNSHRDIDVSWQSWQFAVSGKGKLSRPRARSSLLLGGHIGREPCWQQSAFARPSKQAAVARANGRGARILGCNVRINEGRRNTEPLLRGEGEGAREVSKWLNSGSPWLTLPTQATEPR